MNRKLIIRIVSVVLLLAMVLAFLPTFGLAAASGVTVSAGEKDITVAIGGSDGSGEGQVVRFDANEYPAGDSCTGLSARTNAPGEVVATFALGTSASVTFSRYDTNGRDRLFSKYYLMQGSNIVAGPYYATEIASKASKPGFAMDSIKGITMEDRNTISIAKDLGASNTVINIDLCGLIMANEDANGNPINHTGNGSLMPFQSNGKTYYFNKDYLGLVGSEVADYSKAGMNVTMVVIAWKNQWHKNYPNSLLYVSRSEKQTTMAVNTANELGMGYWIAAMELLADYFSKSADQGLVQKFVIGNEIDLSKDWNLLQPSFDAAGNMQRLPLETYMEEYSRNLRLANLAVKKYNSEMKVLVSLSQGWATNLYDGCAETGVSERYNTYAVKDILDWLSATEKARGDYDWGLAMHPYPVEFRSTVRPTVTDTRAPQQAGHGLPITGDVNTTPWVTPSNLEIYQLYLEQPQNLYNGKVRSVSLTESGLRTYDKTKDGIDEATYNLSTQQQAASIAQFYYRAAMLSCIEEFAYFQPHDRADSNMKIGLMEENGTKKPSYEVWKYIDTERSFDVAAPYLASLENQDAGKKLKPQSYQDLAVIVESKFNWDQAWDESKITGKESKTLRLAGADRFQTAVMVADQLKEKLGVDKFDAVVLASGADFADALSGSYLAAVKKAPILLCYKEKYDGTAIDYVKANLKAGGTVYILGGKNAVKEHVDKKLAEFNVVRLAGDNRFETNLLVLKEAGVKAGEEVLIATGTDFADALSASAAGKPILLVYNKSGKLTTNQKNYLAGLDNVSFCVIGGESAIGEKLAKEIAKYGTTERLAGKNRLVTSVMVAQRYFDNPDAAVVAYGWNFPDGLCGGPLAYAMGAPLILAHDKFASTSADYTSKEAGIDAGYVLGGSGLVANKSARAIFGITGVTGISAA